MCGIAGFISDNSIDGAHVLASMARALVHRGPDGEGHALLSAANGTLQVGLAHRRLAIIDPAGGAQPLVNENGRITLVCNGEIYNSVALREQLIGLGHRFATGSDNETILHAYEQFGLDFVRHLRGMFAFALWDAEREVLLLARDRFGEKPLFYRRAGRTLAFASEIKALLQWPDATARIDAEALPQFLQYRYVPGPATLIEGMRKVPPGCVLLWRQGSWREWRYYTPPDAYPRATDGDDRDPRDPVTRFSAKLDESVALMMASDVPFGAFLSGGIDSSAIVALMARHSAAPVRTFAVGFDATGYSELNHAATVAQAFKTDHHELVIKAFDLIATLPEAARYRDAPVAEPADVPILLLAREARRHVKMVLTGEGSDEVLGGYPKHVAERYAPAYHRLPRLLRHGVIEPLMEAMPRTAQRAKIAVRALGVEAPEERLPRWFGAASGDEVRALCGRLPAAPINGARFPFEVAPQSSALRRILYFDQTSWLPDNLLERGDRMTMAAGVEARLPFMDHELVECVAAQPDDLRVHGAKGKRLLRAAMQPVLPASILQRPKQGFRMPVDEWLRGPMRSMVGDLLLGPDARHAALLNRTQVGRYVSEHDTRTHNHEKLLWMLLNFEIWARECRVTI